MNNDNNGFRQQNSGFGYDAGNNAGANNNGFGYDAGSNNGTGNGFQGAHNAQNPNYTTYGQTTDQNTYYAPQSNGGVPQKPATGTDRSSKTLGVIGLVTSIVCCCIPIVGLVLGILAVSFSKRSTRENGMTTPDASTGFVCGVIAIILCVLMIVGNIISFIIGFTEGIVNGFNDPFAYADAYEETVNDITDFPY